MRSNRSNRKTVRPTAFTLIELLVVIAIIGILAAMLLPALNSARDRGKTALCVSNLKQVGIAITMYADDNGDYYPPGWIDGVSDWSLTVAPYVAKTLATYQNLGSITTSPVFVCPSVRTPGGNVTRTSYSAHPYLFGNSTKSCVSFSPCGLLCFNVPKRQASQSHPSELVLLADGVCGLNGLASPTNYDAAALLGVTEVGYCLGSGPYAPSAPLAVTDFSTADGGGSDQGRICLRHNGRKSANFLFCDGHVETLQSGQLTVANFEFDP